MKVFYKKSHIPVQVARLFAWHARDGAIQRLTPPWAPLTLKWRQGNGIDKGVRVGFDMRVLGVPMTWEAEHIDYYENRMFKDRQIRGPFARWEHTHLFAPDSKQGAVMTDQVAYQLPGGWLSAPFYGHVQKELARMFDYRHRVLAHDLVHYADQCRPMRILISGASGSIGSALVPFLRTCGHEVICLVRHGGPLADDEVYWDPYNDILDMASIGRVDAVINLNGKDISRGKWTDGQKQAIMDSRIQPTRLLVKKMLELDQRPDVFVSASAIGFYGEGADAVFTETDPGGDSFISRVCDDWEQASWPAQTAGIRTVQLRIGVVLTPAGGALARMLPAFAAGCGAKLGKGRQYMSWISMDDTLGSIFHILKNTDIQGPVNLTAPNPVTNQRFTRTLARVLSRPAVFSIPRWLAARLWGEMGKETLLTSARVMPEKLMKTQFTFQYPDLEPALGHLLGRINS
ncbi:MAG: TIGR01777 family oxidoreductase [Desulfotignum sp.]|nr:TIGR01777 family oxidoreductase [Desulfotignum sp.]MCF8137762.1 TIGR01777 family oxidoreductase [Desulfotignum sp.]